VFFERANHKITIKNGAEKEIAKAIYYSIDIKYKNSIDKGGSMSQV
jgi:hypothetical protein